MLHAQNRIAKRMIAFSGNRWPKTTGRLAFRLFSHVQRPPKKRSRPTLNDAAGPKLLQTRSGVVATWAMPAERTSGRKALLIHGWKFNAVHMAGIAKTLNKAGIDCVLLDLPGHGASHGRQLHLGKGIEAIDAAWRDQGPFDIVVGHSFGGAIALNAAIGASMHVPARAPEKLVLLAAPNSLKALFDGFGRFVGLPQLAQSAMEDRVMAILGRALETFVASEQLRDYDGSVLVVHDMDDRDVLYADALRMAGAGDHVRLVTTSGLGHRRILKDEGVQDAIRDHVARPAAAGATVLKPVDHPA